jgi:topoisomerase-4 subunit A
MSFNAEDLIVKENVFVMVTHDGYVKKLSTKSFANNTLDEVGLKEGDYVLRTYEATTLMKLLIITKLGSYLYLPVNEIPVTRLKDLGKHVSNFVPIDPNDEVVNAYIVDEKDASQVITFFTKEGMVKRTELSSFIVSRYNKTYTSMKLKAAPSRSSWCMRRMWHTRSGCSRNAVSTSRASSSYASTTVMCGRVRWISTNFSASTTCQYWWILSTQKWR